MTPMLSSSSNRHESAPRQSGSAGFDTTITPASVSTVPVHSSEAVPESSRHPPAASSSASIAIGIRRWDSLIGDRDGTADRTLQLGSGATLDLPESQMKLEKILGTALPIGYNNLMKGLRAAESVCKITDAAGEGWGTGFLIRGSLVHESLGDDPILVTNAHVISSIPGESQLQAVEAQAHFEVTKGADGEPLVITGLTEIWTSAIRKRDVTLLRFDTEVPELPQPIEAAPVLPPVTEGAFVYVIGHPAGGGVKFSIRGNDLLSYDPESIKVHYTAPTEGGSSGSPVFSSAWQLMAVHHAGNEQMKRLDDPTKTYKANEGITLESIRAEFEATMNDAPGQGGAVG